MTITDEEMRLLTEAHAKMTWKDLPTWKLKYLYQRYIALPAKKVDQVKEIARSVSRVLEEIPMVSESRVDENLPF